MDNQRNLILAVVLCGILILGYEAAVTYYYPTPPETEQVDRATTPEQRVAQDTAQNPAIAAAAIDEAVDLDEALSAGNRVAIDAPPATLVTGEQS